MQSYFLRTSDGYELGLVLDWVTERWAVEDKLTSDPTSVRWILAMNLGYQDKLGEASGLCI